MISTSAKRQSGAVSLFVVVFAMLIITVITISFLRLMITDQMQASNNDLSQSAYDSAQAGVEDAKRALLKYQKVCNDTPANCGAFRTGLLAGGACNTGLFNAGVVSASGGGNPGEVMVQQSRSTGDSTLNQAYTCVKMELSTLDYIGKLTANQSQLVPLVSESAFNTVTLRWFSRDDVGSATGAVNLPGPSDGKSLPTQDNWPSNRPPVMRTQLIQFGSSFKLEDFDVADGDKSNANTVFLYPSSIVSANNEKFTDRDMRKQKADGDPTPASPTSVPLPVQCKANVSGGGYACEMSLQLPEPINGGNRTAFVRLTALYKATEYQVVLSNGTPTPTSIVKFKDVQPEIDSTGRANDLFRRVVSRVDLYDTTFPYPDATIDVTGNLCKDFGVTDTQYIPGTCTP